MKTPSSIEPQNNTNSITKILGNIALLVVLLSISSAITTQYLAHKFGFHASLGETLLGRLYWPAAWIEWSWRWWSTHTQVLQQGLTLFTALSILSMVIFAIGILLRSRKSVAIAGLHGTAHWATHQEIQNSGLLSKQKNNVNDGVYVGGWTNPKTKQIHYLRHAGPEHILAFAPTRSGKGVGLVLPTLLSWQGSVICYDIKGENWALTSGWRKNHAGNKVMKFDPAATDGSSLAFNPLAEICLGTDQEVGDIQNIASMLVDTDGKGLFDHWSKTSHALLTGAILHCCYQIQQEQHRKATLADGPVY